MGMEFTESFLSFVQAFYERRRGIELTDVFTANRIGIFAETNESRPVSVGGEAVTGDFFNFARQAVGKQRQLSLFSTFRPRSNLSVEFVGSYAQSLDPQDEVDGRFLVSSLRTTYLFTRDSFLRVFAQTERQRTYFGEKQTNRGHLFSALFGWEYNPKSHLFVAYNEDWATSEGKLRLGDRVVVFKISYLSNL